jgi:ferric-dicitrate binding protein FerR (iron transport regulator)
MEARNVGVTMQILPKLWEESRSERRLGLPKLRGTRRHPANRRRLKRILRRWILVASCLGALLAGLWWLGHF